MEAISINISAVFLAALSAIILGWVWYSPWFFGKEWVRLVSFHSQKNSSEMDRPKVYLLFVLSWVVATYILSWIVGYLRVATWDNAIVLGLWLSLGFVWALGLPNYLFEKKSLKLYFINSCYTTLAIVISCIVLAVWR